ncbi:MAG: hypothetical protein IT204_24125 [Fimbriimonadaceae bacterium]|nr:hypothetical protein [Fimbriimonadaceae bacterium]
MPTYEDGRIRKFAEQLAAAGVEAAVAARILAGGEALGKSTRAAAKAAWWQGAIERLEANLDLPTCRRVREGCACCLGGKRLQVSRGIARQHATLAARVAAANAARFVFGHAVTQLDERRFEVLFAPRELPAHRCVCLTQAAQPVGELYCYCCGGHVKHHLQHALGVPLTVTVTSSALSSGGTAPCCFELELAAG